MPRISCVPSLLVLLGLAAGCGAPPREIPRVPPPTHLEALMREQSELYPLMTERDLYKLIRQATLGPSHVFMGDDSELDIGLDEEIAQLEDAPSEGVEVIEILDPQANLARVNLRPYLLSGGRAQDLARAVARTAHVFRGDEAAFHASLKAAVEIVPRLVVSFTAKDLAACIEDMEKKGYPAGVHSERYALTYEPAYRIVLLEYLTDRDYGGRHAEPQAPSR
ncbi:MAG: hypothetical protein HY812_11995 [Planctomycetes bacterium]|nr:hypothetical protein [Planctomycetota bacterium]